MPLALVTGPANAAKAGEVLGAFAAAAHRGALLVVPTQVALVPLLKLYGQLGISGTFLAIWLTHIGFGMPLAVYLIRNYMATLPKTVIESEHRRPWWQLGPAVFLVLGALIRELSGEAAAARTQLPADQALAETLAHKYDNPHNPGRCC